MSDLDWFYIVAHWCEDRGLDLGEIVETLDKTPSYLTAHEQFAQGASTRVLEQLLDAARLEMTRGKG